MGKYYDGEEEVKTETQLIDDFLNRGLVYENEIDRNNKTITIGNRVINYGGDESIELDPNTVLESDTGKEEFIAEITTLNFQLTEEEGIPENLVGKYIGFAPINYEDTISDIFDDKTIENPEFDVEINWGDGTIEKINKENYTQYAVLGAGILEHAYEEYGEYEIKIKGNSDILANIYSLFQNEDEVQSMGLGKIKVKQWGTLAPKKVVFGLDEIPAPTISSFKNLEFVSFMNSNISSIPEYIFANSPNIKSFYKTFAECKNLSQIPQNLFTNCINVENFVAVFYNCSDITTVPEDLFANCKKVISFQSAFHNTSLEEIPEGLFSNNTEVKNFWSTFENCKLKKIPLTLFDNCQKVENFNLCFKNNDTLIGEVPKLWLRIPNGEEIGYVGGKHVNGSACYNGCVNVNDYLDIPEYWRRDSLS